MKAVIHFARIGKPDTIYTEGLVCDNGQRLDTCTVLPPEAARVWTRSGWQAYGILSDGQVVHTIRKHHFYHEWFSIVELIDSSGTLLGYYCDVLTPLRKVDGEYYLQDLLLDLWVFPDGSCVELDWDELRDAVRLGMITPSLHQKAEETLSRMVAETQAGVFPVRYLLETKELHGGSLD